MFDPKSFIDENETTDNKSDTINAEDPSINLAETDPVEDVSISLTIVFKPNKSELISWKQNLIIVDQASNNAPISQLEPAKLPIRKELISGGEFTAIEELLEKGAVDPCASYKTGGLVMPAVCYAIKCNKLLTADVLLKHGADINAPITCPSEADYVDYIIHMACREENKWENKWETTHGNKSSTVSPYVIEYLARHGADVNLRNSAGKTPLDILLENNLTKDENIMILIREGADVDTVDKTGETSLIKAVKAGSPAVIYAIAEKTQLINAVDSLGRTALWYAVNNMDKIAVDILLKFGADPAVGEKLDEYVRENVVSCVTCFHEKKVAMELIKEAILKYGEKKQFKAETLPKLESNAEPQGEILPAVEKPKVVEKRKFEEKTKIEEKPKQTLPKFCYRVRKVDAPKTIENFLVIFTRQHSNLFTLSNTAKITRFTEVEKAKWKIELPDDVDLPFLLTKDKFEKAATENDKNHMEEFLDYLKSQQVSVYIEYGDEKPTMVVDYYFSPEMYISVLKSLRKSFVLKGYQQSIDIVIRREMEGQWNKLDPKITIGAKAGSSFHLSNLKQSDSIYFHPDACGEVGVGMFIEILKQIADQKRDDLGFSFEEFSALSEEPFHVVK